MKTPPFPQARFEILYADPPWDYKGQKQHAGADSGDTGGAAVHYPTVPLAEMMAWDIASITEQNALLFMWSSSPHLDQAIQLGKAWQFSWATVAFVWDKQRVNPSFYTMSQCELCLVFKKGKIPTPRGARNVRQFVSEKRGRHSAKPAIIRDAIDAMFPTQKKIELFAREQASGWHSWGLDVSSAEAAAAASDRQ